MQNSPASPISPVLLLLSFLLPFGVFLIWHWQLPFGFVDDAYISMVYAQNIADGYGIVFYPGGERVEGFTNLLWVLVLTFSGLFQISLPFMAHWLGMISAVLSLLLVIVLYQKAYARHDTSTVWNQYFFPCLAAILTALDISFIAWSASGLETLGYTFLLLSVGYGCTVPIPSKMFCSVLLLLSLTRPEGILFLPVVIFKLFFSRKRKESPFKNLLYIVIVPYALLLCVRYFYFGYWLPNTFYAKHDFGGLAVYYRGLLYAMTFIQPRLILLISLLGLALERPVCRSKSIWLFGIVFLHVVITIAEGGDHFALHRFLVPVLPLLSILAIRALQNISSQFVLQKITRSSGGMVVITQSFISLGLVVILSAHAMQLYEYKQDGHFGFSKGVRFHFSEVSWAEGWKNMGLWLKEKYSPDTKVAVITAGAIPFYSRLHCIDMLGLNDVHIAHQPVSDESRSHTGHEKTDAEYVLSHEPQMIQLFPMMLFGSKPSSESDMDDMMTYPAQYDLRNHPQFQSAYRFTSEQTQYGYISFFEKK